MIKSTIQVTLFSLLGIAINFLIQLLLAYYFGATQERDAYFAALTIPTYIAVIFTGSIGMMLLPYLVKYQTEHDSDQLIRFLIPAGYRHFGLSAGISDHACVSSCG